MCLHRDSCASVGNTSKGKASHDEHTLELPHSVLYLFGQFTARVWRSRGKTPPRRGIHTPQAAAWRLMTCFKVVRMTASIYPVGHWTTHHARSARVLDCVTTRRLMAPFVAP